VLEQLVLEEERAQQERLGRQEHEVQLEQLVQEQDAEQVVLLELLLLELAAVLRKKMKPQKNHASGRMMEDEREDG